MMPMTDPQRGSSPAHWFAPVLCVVLSAVACLPTARAGEVRVAVAANFATPLEALRPRFEAATGHTLRVGAGASTGKLYAQIVRGAPWDVLLAADQLRPRLLEEQGHAVPGSRFTYATGRLSLYTASPPPAATAEATPAELLRAGAFRRLAIANPALAPYGGAAAQALRALEVYEALAGHLVFGENIGQTFALVATGNAEFGLVARSQVSAPGIDLPGRAWDIAPSLHAPIRQDAVLLASAADVEAAKAFLTFLRGAEARALLERFGYGPGD